MYYYNGKMLKYIIKIYIKYVQIDKYNIKCTSNMINTIICQANHLTHMCNDYQVCVQYKQ